MILTVLYLLQRIHPILDEFLFGLEFLELLFLLLLINTLVLMGQVILLRVTDLEILLLNELFGG